MANGLYFLFDANPSYCEYSKKRASGSTTDAKEYLICKLYTYSIQVSVTSAKFATDKSMGSQLQLKICGTQWHSLQQVGTREQMILDGKIQAIYPLGLLRQIRIRAFGITEGSLFLLYFSEG